MLIPIQDYPDIYTEVTLGPFDAADFTAADGLVSASTSISSSFTQNQGSGGWTANPTSSQSSQVSVSVPNGVIFPTRNIYVDHAQIRADTISSDNINKLRLLSVSNGQSILMAYRNKQFITSPWLPSAGSGYGGNIGDESSSFSLIDSGSYQPLVANLCTQLQVRNGVHANGRPFQMVPAGGLLVILAEEAPDALVDLYVTVAYSTRAR